MTMSCVADANATASATVANTPMACEGSVLAMTRRAQAIATWASSIQLRRRPMSRVSTGTGSESMNGAQTNFRLYAKPSQANVLIVLIWRPASFSHADNVEYTRRNGRPAEKPSRNITITGCCR